MKILFNFAFYIAALLSLVCGVFCLFDRNILRAAKVAGVFFFAVSFLIFLAKAPLCGVLHLVLWGILIGELIKFAAKLTEKKELKQEKATENIQEEESLKEELPVSETEKFDFKILISPLIGAIFALSIVPFMIFNFKTFEIQKGQGIFDLIPLVFQNNSVSLIALIILIFVIFIGLSSILNIKNVCKKIKNASYPKEKGES